jgi:hypothetical protein
MLLRICCFGASNNSSQGIVVVELVALFDMLGVPCQKRSLLAGTSAFCSSHEVFSALFQCSKMQRITHALQARYGTDLSCESGT